MATCRTCGAEIAWVFSESGVRMPVDPGERPDGNLVIEPDLTGRKVARVVAPGKGTHVSHFTTCPDASKHRKR